MGKPTKSNASDPFRDRLTKLRRAMRSHEVDALLVSDPLDVGYLTGFLGGDSYLYCPGKGKPTLITDRRYEEEVEHFAPIAKAHIRSGGMDDAVAQIAAAHGPERLGVQGEHLTVAGLGTLHAALRKRKIAKRRVEPIAGVVQALRRSKDAGEVALIRKALTIQQAALEAMLPTIKPGEKEIEICARLEYEMMARGSAKPSFDTIVAAKASSSMPHYRPASVKTAKNKPLLIDWGATWQGYHGDMTRTFTLGRWSKTMREIHEVVQDAHEAGAAALRPGITGADADRAAREVIERAGYGPYFAHSLGHGVGLQVHEGPGLSTRATETTLAAGDVVTIEPGIYLAGEGGVRIEDVYVVTERGSRNLCKLPRDAAWSTI